MAVESTVQRQVWAAVASTSIMFRVNTGKAWVGHGKPQRFTDGSVVLYGARPVALGFGLANGDPVVGTSDLIGWTSVVITPEMVGRRVAVFTAIETKRTKGGVVSEDQEKFITRVRQAGGIAGVAAASHQATQLIADWSNQK